MSFRFVFTKEAAALTLLKSGPRYAQKLKRVRKALGQLQLDPKYPSLQSHKYTSSPGPTAKTCGPRMSRTIPRPRGASSGITGRILTA